MNEKHLLAAAWGTIWNANIFFSAWGSLVVALILVTRHFELYFEREDDKHLYHWVGFATAGLIIFSDTIRFWKTYDCKDMSEYLEENPICNRTIFGLVLGAVSCVVGLVMALFQIPLVFAQVTAAIMFVAWCCGISYLTFDEGPAISAGVMYFASWASLLFALAVVAPALLEMVHNLLGRNTEPSQAVTDTVPAKVEATDIKVGSYDVEEEEVAANA